MSKKSVYHFLSSLALLLITPFIVYYSIFLVKSIDFTLVKMKYVFFGFAFAAALLSFSSFLQWIYIFFHELSHAFLAIVFKAEIIDFKVSQDTGFIKSNKENIFIRLAPYIFPLACYLLLFIHFFILFYIRYYTEVAKDFYFSYFVISFFYTFITFYNLKLIFKETSDIDRDKLLLSFTLIINFYFFFSVLLFYCLFNGKNLIEKYFLL